MLLGKKYTFYYFRVVTYDATINLKTKSIDALSCSVKKKKINFIFIKWVNNLFFILESQMWILFDKIPIRLTSIDYYITVRNYTNDTSYTVANITSHLFKGILYHLNFNYIRGSNLSDAPFSLLPSLVFLEI